ncbi:GNAT family N-acetyltransferase [Acinetobacter beijerinckii]|uniref:GNAT family N-acetyltransferase n=1 Tax=Acinetobacter beijerinckii TaxID=262668 RepID=UPI0030167B2B
MSLNIRNAKVDEIEQLVELINLAYRAQSDRSWTTEKSFVEGKRISAEQLSSDLNQSNFELLVGENEHDALVGCIGLTFNHRTVEFGTFAINPIIQNLGYGRELLDYVEAYVAQNYLEIQHLIMYVLDVRCELIAYYQRRGYELTGHTEPYPIDADVGQPLVPIQLIEMKKVIA